MCLKTVTRAFKPNDRIKVGYKVFRKIEHSLSASYHNVYYDIRTKHLIGETYTAADLRYLHKYVPNYKYKACFHVWDSVEEAQYFVDDYFFSPGAPLVICEVIAWDIRAYGIQGRYDSKSFVAKNYRLMREIH